MRLDSGVRYARRGSTTVTLAVGAGAACNWASSSEIRARSSAFSSRNDCTRPCVRPTFAHRNTNIRHWAGRWGPRGRAHRGKAALLLRHRFPGGKHALIALCFAQGAGSRATTAFQSPSAAVLARLGHLHTKARGGCLHTRTHPNAPRPRAKRFGRRWRLKQTYAHK